MASTELSDAELVGPAETLDGAIEARIIPAAGIETAGWVRLKCQFGCGGYCQCLMCPPFTPTPERMRTVLDGYRRAVLVHFGRDADVKAQMVKLERAVFLKGAWKAFGLGAGPCSLCESCTLAAGACRHPENARPSMEACGIDVFGTVRKAGLPIEVVKNHRQCPNYYGLLLVD